MDLTGADGQTPRWFTSDVQTAVSNRASMPDVGRLQTLYVKYGPMVEAVVAGAGGWERALSQQYSAYTSEQLATAPMSINIRLTEAPAEFCVPVKQDKKLSPGFRVKVDVRSDKQTAIPVTVNAMLITQSQKDNILTWEPDVYAPDEKQAKSFTGLKGTTQMTHSFAFGGKKPRQGSATFTSLMMQVGSTGIADAGSGGGVVPMDGVMADNNLNNLGNLGQGMMVQGGVSNYIMAATKGGATNQNEGCSLPAWNTTDALGMAGTSWNMLGQSDPSEAFGLSNMMMDTMNWGEVGSAGGLPMDLTGSISGPSPLPTATQPPETGANTNLMMQGMGGDLGCAGSGQDAQNLILSMMQAAAGVRGQGTDPGVGGSSGKLQQHRRDSDVDESQASTISHTFEFSSIELLKPTRMNKVYMVFVCNVLGVDQMTLVYHVPTIGICRAEQRLKAVVKLGVPEAVLSCLDTGGGGGGGAEHLPSSSSVPYQYTNNSGDGGGAAAGGGHQQYNEVVSGGVSTSAGAARAANKRVATQAAKAVSREGEGHAPARGGTRQLDQVLEQRGSHPAPSASHSTSMMQNLGVSPVTAAGRHLHVQQQGRDGPDSLHRASVGPASSVGYRAAGSHNSAYSRQAMRDFIQEMYDAEGFSRKLTEQDILALLSQAGFPLDTSAEYMTVSDHQFREFQEQWRMTLVLLRKITNLWNLENPCVISGFDMDRIGTRTALSAEPAGTFIVRFSMSQSACLVLSCKTLVNVPGSDADNILHAIIQLDDLTDRKVDTWIRDFKGATHVLDVYRQKRVDKRKIFATNYTRLLVMEPPSQPVQPYIPSNTPPGMIVGKAAPMGRERAATQHNDCSLGGASTSQMTPGMSTAVAASSAQQQQQQASPMAVSHQTQSSQYQQMSQFQHQPQQLQAQSNSLLQQPQQGAMMQSMQTTANNGGNVMQQFSLALPGGSGNMFAVPVGIQQQPQQQQQQQQVIPAQFMGPVQVLSLQPSQPQQQPGMVQGLQTVQLINTTQAVGTMPGSVQVQPAQAMHIPQQTVPVQSMATVASPAGGAGGGGATIMIPMQPKPDPGRDQQHTLGFSQPQHQQHQQRHGLQGASSSAGLSGPGSGSSLPGMNAATLQLHIQQQQQLLQMLQAQAEMQNAVQTFQQQLQSDQQQRGNQMMADTFLAN